MTFEARVEEKVHDIGDCYSIVASIDASPSSYMVVVGLAVAAEFVASDHTLIPSNVADLLRYQLGNCYVVSQHGLAVLDRANAELQPRRQLPLHAVAAAMEHSSPVAVMIDS